MHPYEYFLSNIIYVITASHGYVNQVRNLTLIPADKRFKCLMITRLNRMNKSKIVRHRRFDFRTMNEERFNLFPLFLKITFLTYVCIAGTCKHLKVKSTS
jgi:hypothetical protein